MRQKKKKAILGLVVGALLISVLNIPAFATDIEKSPYVETHKQIDLNNLNVSVVNSDKILVSVDENINLLKKMKATTEKRELEEYIKINPEAEDKIIEQMNDNQTLFAIGYTEALIEMNEEGQLERVKAEDTAMSIGELLIKPFVFTSHATNNPGTKYHLYLETSILGGNWVSSRGQYEYRTNTRAYWTDNSAESGKCYPAGGDDFLLAAVPTSMTIDYDSFSLKNNNGKAGTDYARNNGGTSFIQYQFADDPFGPAQMSEANLFIRAYGEKKTQTRQINSYYIHTWKQMSIQVSVTGGAGVGPDGPNLSVGLSITPGIQDKQWQLYSYVTFNF